ncbi:hypothetical protein DFH27DRAFT_626288 [Peziza echinospora]|nr:hypothetical protein DFH27DRAFT_626288 [Peziza echinospora]
MISHVPADSYNVHSRPIRPLPKRRIRSRLSEDVRTALFAPTPANPPRLFQSFGGDTSLLWNPLTKPPSEVFSAGAHADLNADTLQESSDDEDNSLSSVAGNNGSTGTGPRSATGTPGAGGILGLMDSHDYTNNKKKRKIPSPANIGGAGGNVTGGANMNAGSQSSNFSPNGPNTTPRSRWKSSSATQRSPLSASSGNSNIRRTRRYVASPFDGRRPAGRLFSQCGSDDTQSTASSQNDIGYQPSDKSGLGPILQSQFTFEHITPASTSLAHQASFPQQKSMSTVGTQTSPSISASNAYPPTPTPKKKGMRPKQAQQRLRRPVYGAQGNPNGEFWICEFCEYESIFGERPEALMRQYDIKERKERRRLREKQRLLDKAKQKNKKNTGKSSKKAVNPNSQHATSSTGQSTSLDFQDTTPIPSANSAPIPKPRRNSHQVQTESEVGTHHVSSGRGAGGGGGVGGGGVKATTGALAGGGLGGGAQGGGGS